MVWSNMQIALISVYLHKAVTQDMAFKLMLFDTNHKIERVKERMLCIIQDQGYCKSLQIKVQVHLNTFFVVCNFNSCS